MYCTVEDMQKLLMETITMGDQNIGTPIPGRPGINRDTLTPEQAEQYILLAQEQIDSRLRAMYVCPLRQVKTYETTVTSMTVAAGTNVTVAVRTNVSFGIDQEIRMQSKYDMETARIVSVNSNGTDLVLDSLSNAYVFDDKISIIEFPDSIRLTTAQFACSFLIDKLFTAEQSPDVSEYGKKLRGQAKGSLNSILAGESRLFGQDHTGRRFVRNSLFDALSNPAQIQRSEEGE